MKFQRLNVNINGVPAPGLIDTNESINDVTYRLGHLLPDYYLDFIKNSDGGHPEIGTIIIDNGDTPLSFSVDWFYSFSNPKIDNIIDAFESWKILLGKHNLPIARDAGGNQFFLNFEDNTPSVWIYMHEEAIARYKLANSFEEFLSLLQLNPDFI